MALAALVGAYQEDDAGGLRALLPLAGETLLDYQLRCLAAAGAAPIVVLVERLPPALAETIDRLRREGLAVVAVSDGVEAASRFEAGSDVMVLADGVAPDINQLTELVEGDRNAILAVTDDEAHAGFERIDAERRWAGLMRIEAGLIGSTAAMLGDWDMQSTLLRRAIQAGAPVEMVESEGERGSLLAEDEASLQKFQQRLLVASRAGRDDAVARYLLPIVEEAATERLMHGRVAPRALLVAAATLIVAAAFCFTRGWLGPALGLLLLSLPLDIVARRLALLRMRPIDGRDWLLRSLWPLSGLALLALGWFLYRHAHGWGAAFAAATTLAFAEAVRVEARGIKLPFADWLFSRRLAVVLAVPFALGGWWTPYLVTLALYAATSFFLVQHLRHQDH